MMKHSRVALIGAIASGLIWSVRAPGQTVTVTDMEQPAGQEAPDWMKRLAIDPQSPAARKYAAQQKTRKETEKELRRLRMKHFGSIRSEAIRQEGILKLRTYTDPALFPLLIDLFKGEQADVRTALLDHFRDSQSDEGDTALAWLAIHDDDAAMRTAAKERLDDRLKKDKTPPVQIKLVIYEGLRSDKEAAMANAAQLAQGLNLLEVIPWLINAQVTGQPIQTTASAGATGTPNGALAWIMVGQQTTFVSDLQPVVGPNAVAFDPQLSVVTTGTLLRVVDAAVVEYHVDIHNTLTEWTSAEWGQSTSPLGYNILGWRQWYKAEFEPFLAQRAAAAKAAEVK